MKDERAPASQQKSLRFGMFMGPFHATNLDPSYALERDLRTIELLDRLGYDEAWIGEHMSCTTEPISAPMMFLASLIHRTKNIRFGTGVIALPNHHPAVVAAGARGEVDTGLSLPPQLASSRAATARDRDAAVVRARRDPPACEWPLRRHAAGIDATSGDVVLSRQPAVDRAELGTGA